MSNKKVLIFVAIVTLVIVSILLYRIDEKKNPLIYKTNEKIQLESGVPVRVTQIENGFIQLTKKFSGTVEGISEAVIVADLTLKAQKIYRKVGDYVKKGDIIVELSKKAVGNMSLKYEQTLLAYKDSKINLERNENLYKSGAIPKSSLDKAQLNFDMNQSNLNAVKDAIFIKSPFNGQISEIYVQEGNTIRSGMPVARIVKSTKMKIILNVNETDISKIKFGQKCIIKVNNEEFNGIINEVSLAANRVTRDFEVKVVMENSHNKIRSGMFALVYVITDEKDVLKIDKDVLHKNMTGEFVWIVSKDNIVIKKYVKTGFKDKQFVEIISGLSLSDKVIVQGANKIQNESQKALIIKD